MRVLSAAAGFVCSLDIGGLWQNFTPLRADFFKAIFIQAILLRKTGLIAAARACHLAPLSCIMERRASGF
jgi:hypothetical protein